MIKIIERNNEKKKNQQYGDLLIELSLFILAANFMLLFLFFTFLLTKIPSVLLWLLIVCVVKHFITTSVTMFQDFVLLLQGRLLISEYSPGLLKFI